MSNQENNQEQIQFPAQQELKHLRTRCGKVYALGNNRFRAVVQTTPVHEYDAATHQWVELSAEKRQQMAAQAHSPIATFADNSAEFCCRHPRYLRQGGLDSRTFRTTSVCGSATRITTATA